MTSSSLANGGISLHMSRQRSIARDTEITYYRTVCGRTCWWIEILCIFRFCRQRPFKTAKRSDFPITVSDQWRLPSEDIVRSTSENISKPWLQRFHFYNSSESQSTFLSDPSLWVCLQWPKNWHIGTRLRLSGTISLSWGKLIEIQSMNLHGLRLMRTYPGVPSIWPPIEATDGRYREWWPLRITVKWSDQSRAATFASLSATLDPPSRPTTTISSSRWFDGSRASGPYGCDFFASESCQLFHSCGIFSEWLR
jgi:hypothetical protein